MRERDIFWWTETFLKAANDEDLGADDEVEQWRPSAPAGFFADSAPLADRDRALPVGG
ncbi:hypothetical protein D3C83_262690 [compost metagenome]